MSTFFVGKLWEKKMKRIILLAINFCLIFTLTNIAFAGRLEKTGEYYRYFEDDGSVARDKFVDVDRKTYYFNEDGYAIFNSWIEKDGNMYYFGNDAALKKDEVIEVGEYKYNIDSEGRLKKGWSDDYLYYGDLEDGFLLNGFQELDVPKDWITEEGNEKTEWFYFDVNTNKRIYSEYEPYISKTIGGRKYCFDQNGIIRTGWRLIKETTPVMKGYMYFVEESNDNFKFGEAVTDTWYAVEPPAEVLPNAEVRYFYFNGQGQPRTAPEGKYQKVRLNEKTFLFNEYGFAVFGIHEVNGEYYYFGDNVKDCSMKTGLMNKSIDGTNDGATFYFLEDGTGYTGIKNNKLYYKGKLQMASAEQKYIGMKIMNVTYLVNSSGTIQKNKKKVKDGDGLKWSTNSSGIVTYKDEEADYVEAVPPSLTEDE